MEEFRSGRVDCSIPHEESAKAIPLIQDCSRRMPRSKTTMRSALKHTSMLLPNTALSPPPGIAARALGTALNEHDLRLPLPRRLSLSAIAATV